MIREKMKYSTSIEYDAGGIHLVVYTDDDGASGNGDNARVGRWYGSRADCERMARTPERVPLHPMREEPERADPFDLACERRYD